MSKAEEITKLKLQLQKTKEFRRKWARATKFINKLTQDLIVTELSEFEWRYLNNLTNWLAENLEATGIRGRWKIKTFYFRTYRPFVKQDLFEFLLTNLANIKRALFFPLGITRVRRQKEFLKHWNSAGPVMGVYIGWLRERIRKLESGEIDVITRDFTVDGIAEEIETKFRTLFHAPPEYEREVQKELEKLLTVLDIPHHREQTGIPVSVKTTFPDFTVDELSLAIEVKLIQKSEHEKRIVDEIAADIHNYSSKYSNLLFVIYDIGIIRDFEKFKFNLEPENVCLILIKH